MSNEVKRYDPINSDGTCGMCIEDADYGAYVEYADYAALEAELARLRAGQEPVAIPDSDGLFVVSVRDNWDGEGDVYTLLARMDEKGEWYSDGSGKPLLHCEGDAVLRVWSLTEQSPQPSAVPEGSRLDADDVRAACQNAIEVFADEENAEQCREVAEYMREVLLADLGRAAPQPSAVPDDHAEQALVMVPAGWKLVPVEPTPEMVSAAEEAHMPFGDMDIALRMAILSAAPAKATDGLRIGAWRDALEKIAKYAPAVNCAARTEIERIGLIAVHALIAFSAPQFSQTSAHQEAINGAAAPAPATVQHTDDAAVDRFAAVMKAKLAKSRDKGRHGWQNCTAPHLSAMLYDHLYKADPVDVANFAMMLHQNGQYIELPQHARGNRQATVQGVNEVEK